MNRKSLVLFIGIAVAAKLAFGQQALQPNPAPSKTYRINFGGVEAGPSLYPLNKPYKRFSEDEKAALRALYVDMPSSDEPPFPEDGLIHVIRDIGEFANRLKQSEDVSIAVVVNDVGEATSIRLLRYQNIETAKAVAYFLVKERYKPARCDGLPCAMEFPFRVRLLPQ
jgi:hypothetical protein